MYPQTNQPIQQSSKPYKIFGHGRAGIDISQVSQGRNVQPFTSTKRPQIIERNNITPFDGYGSNPNQTNLAHSQVFDNSGEAIRRIVREQLSKIGGADIPKLISEVSVLKTQIKQIKQNLSKNANASLKNDQQFQALKKEVTKQFDRVLQQYHHTTAANLRQVLRKFDENVKKQCKANYLSIQFVTDAQKQFVQLEDRIVLLQSKADGNKRKAVEEPIVVAQALDIRLKKVERQYQLSKRNLTEVQNQLNQCSNELKQFKQFKIKSGQELGLWKLRVQDLKKNHQEHQRQLRNINSTVEQVKRSQTQLSSRVSNLEQTNSKSPERWISKLQSHNSSSEVKQYLDTNKNLAVSGLMQDGSQSSFDSGKYNKNLFKSPQKDKTQQKAQQPKRASSLDYIPEDVEPSPLSYRLDKQNYLLDQQGNYILDNEGKQIKLSQQQVNTIKSSNIIRYQE